MTGRRMRPADLKQRRPYKYEVAVSYAGEDRETARQIASGLRDHHLRVFFDEFERPDLVAADLVLALRTRYQTESQYCVVLVSRSYVGKPWPSRVELPAIEEADLAGPGGTIIPVLLDDSVVPGLPRTIGHIDLRLIGVDAAVRLIAQKVMLGYATGAWTDSRRVTTELRYYSAPTRADVARLFSHGILMADAADVRYAAISGVSLLHDPYFRSMQELLIRQLRNDGRTMTLTVYLLDPRGRQFAKYADAVEESPESISSQIEESVNLLRDLADGAGSRLVRARIRFFDTMPVLTLLRLGPRVLFRPYQYRGGDRRHDLYEVDETDSRQASLGLLIRNYERALEMAARTDTYGGYP